MMHALANIRVGDRLRELDIDHARGIAASMGVVGQMQAVLLTVPDADGVSDLVVGRHRLAAAELLGWTEIKADYTDLRGDKLRLLEIDENLKRRELSPYDRAVALAERKRIYDKIHPETTKGKAGAFARWHASDKLSFAREVEEKLGISRRTVERAIALVGGLAPEARAMIRGTALADKGGELKALAKIGQGKQRAVVEAVLSGRSKTIAAAEALVDGRRAVEKSPEDRQFEALEKAWDRAGAKAQRRFLRKLRAAGALGDLLPAEVE